MWRPREEGALLVSQLVSGRAGTGTPALWWVFSITSLAVLQTTGDHKNGTQLLGVIWLKWDNTWKSTYTKAWPRTQAQWMPALIASIIPSLRWVFLSTNSFHHSRIGSFPLYVLGHVFHVLMIATKYFFSFPSSIFIVRRDTQISLAIFGGRI